MLEHAGANVTLEGFDVTHTMHYVKVSSKSAFPFENTRAYVTLESLDVTNTMKSCHMALQVTFFRELPAANLALVSGVRMFWFGAAAALSMRRVVVSADR